MSRRNFYPQPEDSKNLVVNNTSKSGKILYSFLCLLLISAGVLSGSKAIAQTTYNYTGGVQTYTVAAGVTQIFMDISGAKGGAGIYNLGAPGGRVQVTMNVTPAQVYSIYVGNVGSPSGPNGVTYGGNGTGHVGGDGTTGGGGYPGGGGGGSTEIWYSGAPIIVAGAGAGGSGDCSYDIPGKGGGPVGGTGANCGSYNAAYDGSGGNTNTSTGGAAGTCGGAGNGTQFNGGNAGYGTFGWSSGGGAGWYGGGGGCSEGPGGGGSSYPASAGGAITSIVHTQGYNNTGAGVVTITVVPPTPTSMTVPANGSYMTGQVLDFTVTFSNVVTVTGTPQIGINLTTGTVHANYVSGSGTSTLTFEYTILSGDQDNPGISTATAINLNGGTIQDALSDNAILDFSSVEPATSGILVNPNTPPTFNNGTTQGFSICENAGSNDITSLLHVSDVDASQTETWTVSSVPNNGGTLTGFSTSNTASSGSTNIAPGNTVTYMPASGFAGIETFAIQVSDGMATATTTFTVTVNPLPSSTGATNSGPICAGGTVTLNDNSSNATGWSWMGSDASSSTLQSPVMSPTATTTYSLTLTNTTTGCNQPIVYSAQSQAC